MNPDHDRFRRSKATYPVAFFFGALRLVSLAMIEQGAAFVYPHSSDKDRVLTGRLREAQLAAISRGAGFWGGLLRSGAEGRAYLGNRGTKRFHALSCALGGEVKNTNQVRFSSLREAFEAGFGPARECTPWPRNGDVTRPQPEI